MPVIRSLRERLVPAPAPELEGLAQWRERFLQTILGAVFGLGVLVAVPSVLAAIRDALWSIVVIDAVALVVVFLLWRGRHWAYAARAWGLVLLVYALGTLFLVRVGPVSQIYLLAFPVMVSLLLGLRPAVFALALNAVTLFLVGWLADADLPLPGFDGLPWLKWAVITINFIFVDAMITLASAIMLHRLEAALARQQAVTLSLRTEQARLRAAYKDLMHASIERQRAEGEVKALNAGLEKRVQERTLRLESANRELAAFSYTVSHDLRGPLTAINGFSGLLARTLGTGADEGTRHALERIQANTRHMGELLDALMHLSQLSRTELRPEPLDLSAMARATLAACAERDPARRVRTEVADGLRARGDRGLVQVALDNLLGNAWKFTAPVADALIRFGRDTTPDGEAFFFVRDNGVGFESAEAGQLFSTFRRLHPPEAFPGTGVGLITVQRVVTRHGGRVWAEAAPGAGATFRFTLGPGSRDGR